jgi:DNA-binding transcriptional ArsR family regulator
MVEIPRVSAIIEGIKARIGQIEEQLRQHRDLSDELERLRGALERLEGGVSTRVRGRRASAHTGSRRTTPATKPRASGKGSASAPTRRRPTPRGQTRARILEALKDGPKTAGEIAAATGVARGTASTTLSKLAKTGEVVKAERGYRLPE